jgi:hypothetical protein
LLECTKVDIEDTLDVLCINTEKGKNVTPIIIHPFSSMVADLPQCSRILLVIECIHWLFVRFFFSSSPFRTEVILLAKKKKNEIVSP